MANYLDFSSADMKTAKMNMQFFSGDEVMLSIAGYHYSSPCGKHRGDIL